MANTRMFAIALQSKDIKEVHVFKHTVPDDYDTTNRWQANHREVFNKAIVVAILIIAFIICCLYRKNKKRR